MMCLHRSTERLFVVVLTFVVCGPEVANILEFTAGFRASVTHDDEKGSIGAVKVGSLSKKFDVIVDPYFPRNVILVGRRGSLSLKVDMYTHLMCHCRPHLPSLDQRTSCPVRA
jgi:hypothetical protein